MDRHEARPRPPDRGHAGGRPRDAGREAAIIAAALDLVAEEGLPGLTMDALASRAGASKATLYRRWPDRLHLALHLLAQAATARPAPPATGGLRDDLAALLHTLDGEAHGALGALVLGLAVEARRSPDLAQALRDHHEAEHERIRSVLDQGRDRRGLDADADLDLLAALVASVSRDGAVTAAAPRTRGDAEAVADRLLTLVIGRRERAAR